MNGFTEEITLEGHIIDSGILSKVWGTVMDLGGEFDLQEIRVGKRKNETSFARVQRIHLFRPPCLLDPGGESTSDVDQYAPPPVPISFGV